MKIDKDVKSIIYMRMTTLDERLKNKKYGLWIKAAMCLQYAKEGLEPFATKQSQDLHTNVLRRCGNPSPKGICSSAKIIHLQGVIKCCGQCERYLDALSQVSTGKLNLRNSEITALPIQHWQMAKLLMNEGQDALSTDAGKADIAGILNFIDHYTLAKADIQDVKRIQEVRNIRNRIMHSGDMKVTSDEFTNKIIPALIGLLEEKKVVENNLTAKEAIDKIKEVAASNFHITKESEFQILENAITTKFRHLENKLNDMEAHQSRDFKTEMKRVHEVLQTLKQKVNSDAELRARDNQETKDNFDQLGSDLAKCICEIEAMSAKVEFMFLEDKTKYPVVCPKCRSGIKLPAPEGCENQDAMLKGCVNKENLSELWVCCIKLYPWIKAELGKNLTVCIASELLGEDNVDSMMKRQRCMAVDELLKHVLKQRNLLLVPFLNQLKSHCKPSNAFRKKLEAVWPTKKEITEYACLNGDLFETSPCKNDLLDTDHNQRERPNRLQPSQRRRIQFIIQDIETINALLDNLLSNCYFSLLDHEDVHNLLARENKPGAAECLIEKMANGSEDMIRECCKILNSRGQEHVSRILTSPDENPNETGKQISVEKDLYSSIINRLAQTKDYVVGSFKMTINNVLFRSIVFHLQPIAEKSWQLMADKCSAGNFTEILEIIFPFENVLRFFSNTKNRLRVTIFSTPHHTSDIEGKEMAVLKLELTTTDSIRTQDAITLVANPIKRNIDLFCEELEINHDLLLSLKQNCVVQDDIEERLKHIYSREAAIKCLMESISQPEIGYSVLKNYSKDFYPYLYQELEKKEKDEHAKKLLFQCEAWTVPKNRETVQTTERNNQYTWITENIKCFFNKDGTHERVQTISETADGETPTTSDLGEREPQTTSKPMPFTQAEPKYTSLPTEVNESRLEAESDHEIFREVSSDYSRLINWNKVAGEILTLMSAKITALDSIDQLLIMRDEMLNKIQEDARKREKAGPSTSSGVTHSEQVTRFMVLDNTDQEKEQSEANQVDQTAVIKRVTEHSKSKGRGKGNAKTALVFPKRKSLEENSDKDRKENIAKDIAENEETDRANYRKRQRSQESELQTEQDAEEEQRRKRKKTSNESTTSDVSDIVTRKRSIVIRSDDEETSCNANREEQGDR